MEQRISGESPNNLPWKQKLEDTVSLPGETLPDKNTAWEKLHSRLSQSPRRISTLWYRAAAACLFLMILVPLITGKRIHETPVKSSAFHMPLKKTTTNDVLPAKEESVAAIVSSITKKRKTTETIVRTVNKKFIANDLVKKQETILAVTSDDPKVKQQQPAFSSPGIDTSPVIMLAVVPAKKKLRVVHINELGDPLTEISNVSHEHERRSFQLKFIKQGIYTTSSHALNNTGFNIFKTRNVPLN